MKFNPLNPIVVRLFTIGATAWFGLDVSAQTLIHRYSFNDTAGGSTFVDSVGGSDGSVNNGTAVNPNSASLDGSQLQLDGTGGFGILPSGLVSSETSVTIEFWASFSPTNAVWTRTWAFGNQNGTAEDTSINYCHYAGGNYQNLLENTHAGGAYANNPAGLNGATNVHVTCIVDPPDNKIYYYNGTKLISSQSGSVVALTNVVDTYGLIGRSLYDTDPTLSGSMNEFRIYSGVVPLSQVALNDASGPDSIVSDPGTLTAIHFGSPLGSLVLNQKSQQTLSGDFTGVTGLDLIAYGGAAFTSLNPSVVTISTSGLVTAVGTGSGQVVASYGGMSATNTFSVTAPPPVLTHRYSFASDASDSVGGANGTLMGTASVSGGQLVLDGSSGCCLSLPGGQINITTNSAITIDTWVTFGNASTWAELYSFGNTNNGAGLNAIACVPCADSGGFHHWGITENFPSGGQTPGWSHGWNNLTAHVTSVIDPATGAISVYRDGVLEVAQYNATAPLSNIANNYAFIGRSLFDADPYLQASVDEFRIYNGALTPAQVAMSQQSGPNSTGVDPGALNSIAVVPTNYPAFAALVPPVILANYANLAGFNMLPTVTASGNAAFSTLIVSSSDTNIISVNSQNMLTTHRPGTVMLTASYAGKTNSATVTVRNNAVLTHRYSFASDASDSVGGANGTLQGAASISGGELQLTGNNADYLSLPSNLLTNYNAVTVDTWVDFAVVQSWARLWQFYDQNSGGTQNEFDFAPGWGGGPDGNIFNAGFPWGNNIYTAGPLVGSQVYHITCEYGNGQMLVYTNAVLMGSLTGVVAPASSAATQYAVIGHSPYNDPGISGSVDEFRIYKGLLSSEEITASDILGPSQVLSTTAVLSAVQSGGNNVLSWPLASAGFALQTTTNLISGWTTLTNAPLISGSSWQIVLPASSGNTFYRLVR